MRELGYTKDNLNISRMTIDTRTVYPKGDYSAGRMIISFNIDSYKGYGLLADIDELGYVSCWPAGVEVVPIINNNKDYILNLHSLKYDDEFEWSDKEIINFEKALYQFINEEKIDLGMAIIEPAIMNYNNEEKSYSFFIDNYTPEKKILRVTYYKDSDKYVFDRW